MSSDHESEEASVEELLYILSGRCCWVSGQLDSHFFQDPPLVLCGSHDVAEVMVFFKVVPIQ